MEYIHLLKDYYLEGLDEIITPINWMNRVQSFFDQPSCFNVNRNESLFLYFFIILVKSVIVIHGMTHIIPMWLSLTCIFALRLNSHYLMISKKVVACVFTPERFGLLWALLWQCAPNITAKHFFYSIVLAIMQFNLYIWIEISLDMYIVLLVIWYLVRSFVNLEFNVIFLFIVGGMFYTSLGFGWQLSPHFCMFLYTTFATFLFFYGIYLSERDTDEVFRLFKSVVTGMAIIMVFFLASVAYTHYLRYTDILKDVEVQSDSANLPEENKDLIDATREALTLRKALKINKSVSVDSKPKSTGFTIKDDRLPDHVWDAGEIQDE